MTTLSLDPSSVFDLAAQQDDPLHEKVLALLYTDRLVSPETRRLDHRTHWQFLARTDSENFGSHLWLTDGQPIDLAEVARFQSRAEAALRPLLTRSIVRSITVRARQTDHVTIALEVSITRPNQVDWTQTYQFVRSPNA